MPKKLFQLLLTCYCLTICASALRAEDQAAKSGQSSAASQGNNPRLMGAVEYQDEDAKVDSYSVNQEKAIAFFADLDKRAKILAKGSTTNQANLTDGALNYLSGVYLYCAMNSGVCPLILDSILEADIVNSRLGNKPECPNMKKFWTYWVRNDMERRLSYAMRTALVSSISNFNAKQRPAYIRCEDTVKETILGYTSTAGFFIDRYRPEKRFVHFGKKMVTLLESIKKKIPNVFYATGMQADNSDSGDATEPRPLSPPNGPDQRRHR